MFVEAGWCGRDPGQVERFVLAWLEGLAVEERHDFIEHRRIRTDRDVVRRDVGQPEAIVGHPRADALSRRGQPPMLHITFDELARGGAQDLRAGQRPAWAH